MSFASRRSTLTVSALLTAAALTLSACGGSTVTSDEVEDTTTTSSATTTTTESEETSSAAPKSSESKPDQGAQEIEELPETPSNIGEDDQEYLDQLAEGGVNVDGVEDVLIGVAASVCGSGPVEDATAAAVAGQLVEQGRSDQDAEATARVIEQSAREIYC